MRSVFTDDFSRSIVSGRSDRKIEVHHIFGGFNRDRSTKYGYVVPLLDTEHPNGSWARANWVKHGEQLMQIDKHLKISAQLHFEAHHGSREDFIREFGRSYL